MTALIDMVGLKCGKLTVLCLERDARKNTHWRCVCECGKETVKASIHLRSGASSHCGCVGRGVTWLSRINHRIEYKDNGCHQWNGALNKGYGVIKEHGKSYSAHRLIYEFVFGPIAGGLDCDHLCRNRACVNPMHIEIVTRRENVLRGVGVSAINAKKTHCKHGHEFTKENTYVYPSGRNRHCRTCGRIRKREIRKMSKGII